MRICFVSKEVAGLSGGGIGTYIAEAGKALGAGGHEVWLVTEYPGDDRTHLLDQLPGFHKVLANGHGVPVEERLQFFHGNPHYSYSYLVHQTLMRLDVKFDYIEFADYEGEGFVPFKEHTIFSSYGDTLLGLMMHSPTWECFAYDQQEHRADILIRETCNQEEEAIRSAPMINSPSRGLRDEVLGRLGLEREVEIIRYPMELDEEVPEPPLPAKSLADLRFLYYGRIEPRKGVEELIEAFTRMPELRLEIIGGDVPYSPYGKSLREYLERRVPDNVEFVDAIPRPELLKRIHDSQVCIFPSLFENWPNTCIEAMAAARVVIGSKHGGMAEMIEDGVSGFHVDGRSADDICRVIQEDLAAALPRLDKIGAAAAARMRKFSDQQAYCDALIARIVSKKAEQQPAPSIDLEKRKVSVVIPFYKDTDTVDETVDSAVAQTHANLEILIVNDGSPLADSKEILARQAAKDDRIRILEKKNGGLGSARNHGIREATGDYLLFVDADNILRPDYAASGVLALERAPERGFATPFASMFDDASGDVVGIYNPLPFDRSTGLLVNRFGDAGAFFRRSLFVEGGHSYDEILIAYEDWALWMDLEAKGVKGQIIPRVLYDYRVRSDSMMQEDGIPNHPALIGLMIHRHFPMGTDEERSLLTTVFQVAGQSICRVMFGHPDHLPHVAPSAPDAPEPNNTVASDPAGQSVTAAPPIKMRHAFVDELSRISRKVPLLNSTMRILVAGGLGILRKLKRKP